VSILRRLYPYFLLLNFIICDIKSKKTITARILLDTCVEAFETASDPSRAIKVVLEVA